MFGKVKSKDTHFVGISQSVGSGGSLSNRSSHSNRLSHFHLNEFNFKDYTVYGSMGALVMSEEQEIELSRMGRFVFTQGKDGTAHVRAPENPIGL